MTNDTGIGEDERALLRESVRGFLSGHWPVEGAVERANDAAAVTALWRKLAGQGLTRLGFDAAEGGLREILLAFEELGRASCPAPLLGAVILNLTLRRHPGSTPLEMLCQELHRGDAAVAVAFGAFDGDRAAGRTAGTADALNGRMAFAEGAATATHFALFADLPSGLAIVPAGANGLTAVATPGLAVPALSELSFAGIAAPVVSLPAQELEELAEVARVCAAARALGAAERGFELALEHAKLRRQFGQFIGQFQAIQHKLADCLVRLDGARLTLDAAATMFDQGRSDWRVFAAAAVAYAGPALRQTVLEAHHTMGAIGYAEEHEMPRHFRRIHADLVRFGGAPKARADLAGHLLQPRAATLPDFDLDPAATAFRHEVRQWLAANWHGEREAADNRRPFKERGWDPEFSCLMGRQGWIGLGWPKAHGGAEKNAAEQLAFVEEMEYAQAPRSHIVGETIVGPALIRYGTAEQQAQYLPAILRGEMTFALGYSEPEAGSDLASLRTRAVRDGGDWLINGQKLWSTGGDKAEHVWLAVRTDPDAKPRYAGISVFILSLRSPGISIRPSLAMYGKTFSAVFYDDVRVSDRALIGGVNNGWKVITDALASERVMIGGHVARLRRALDRLTDYVRESEALREDAVVRDRIGVLAAEIEAAHQFAIRNVRLMQQGKTPRYEAAMTKLFAGELQERLGEAALDILGAGGLLGEDAKSAPVPEMEQVLRHSIMGVIGGGTAEIQRNIIAIRGLGLPR